MCKDIARKKKRYLAAKHNPEKKKKTKRRRKSSSTSPTGPKTLDNIIDKVQAAATQDFQSKKKAISKKKHELQQKRADAEKRKGEEKEKKATAAAEKKKLAAEKRKLAAEKRKAAAAEKRKKAEAAAAKRNNKAASAAASRAASPKKGLLWTYKLWERVLCKYPGYDGYFKGEIYRRARGKYSVYFIEDCTVRTGVEACDMKLPDATENWAKMTRPEFVGMRYWLKQEKNMKKSQFLVLGQGKGKHIHDYECQPEAGGPSVFFKVGHVQLAILNECFPFEKEFYES